MTLETNSFLFSEGKKSFSFFSREDFCPSLKILFFSPLLPSTSSSTSSLLLSSLLSSLLLLPHQVKSETCSRNGSGGDTRGGSDVEPHKCVLKSTRTTKNVSFSSFGVVFSLFAPTATPVSKQNAWNWDICLLEWVGGSSFSPLSLFSLSLSFSLSCFLCPFSAVPVSSEKL